MGSYLRTNYRITGKELDAEAIGGGVVQGSWGGGAGTRREYGGFIMGSFNSTVYSVIHPISAYGAMSEYFGDGMFDSGYKIFPFAIWNGSIPIGGTASVGYHFMWTVSGSLFWVIGNKQSVWAKDAQIVYNDSADSGLAATVTITIPSISQVAYVRSGFASNESVHFVWAGFIVSGP